MLRCMPCCELEAVEGPRNQAGEATEIGGRRYQHGVSFGAAPSTPLY